MNDSRQQDPLDDLVRQAFGKPMPGETREELAAHLALIRRTQWSRCDDAAMTVARPDRPWRLLWVAGATCSLAIILAGALLLRRHSSRRPARQLSYACAVAEYPVSSARCMAVFYSDDNRTVWTERRLVVVGPEGIRTTIVAYNAEQNGEP